MSQQLGLFTGNQRKVIADDGTGTIVYMPGVFARDESERIFTELRESIPWESHRRWMYDREVDEPRLTSHYSEPPFPAVLEEIRERIEPIVGVTIERIGLNLYRDERDSVAWHNDRIAVYGTAPTIALVSFGATRRMQLRTKPIVEQKRSLNLNLEAGSLLVMSRSSQLFWDHAIPKERKPIGARISVALRKASD